MPRPPAERVEGYGFLLARAPLTGRDTAEDAGRRPRGEGQVERRYLQILRNGICLRERAVDVPAGPLTLWASRDGATLEVQVNNLDKLVFPDAFPLPDRRGRFGLHWPVETGLTSLVLQRQARAAEASPLEEADELFARGQFKQARPLYQQQAGQVGATDVAEEARYKAALCLEMVNRSDEATREYEPMCRGGGRWARLAACHLWWLLLKAGQFAAAEDVLARSAFWESPEEVFLVLPEEMRERIVRTYFLSLVGIHSLLPPADLVTRLERCVRLSEQVPDLSVSREDSLVALMRAYQIQGRPELALVKAEAYLADADRRLPSWDRLRVAAVLAEYTWLLQSRQEAGQARKKLDLWLFEAPGVIRGDHFMMPWQLASLLVERARLDAALGDWKGAEEDAERCLKLCADQGMWSALNVTTARLVQGFAREAQGDAAGAARAWQEASLSRAPAVGPDKAARLRYWSRRPTFLREMMPQLIQAGLTGDLNAEEGKATLDGVLDSYAGSKGLGEAAGAFAGEPSTCTAFGTMWQTGRGRKLARQYVLHEIPFPEAIRQPVFLIAHEVVRQQAFGGTFTDEQDQLMWKLLQEAYALVRDGKLNKTRMLPLGLIWQSKLAAVARFSWGPVSQELERYRGVRGLLAYVLGRRCLQMGDKTTARFFFEAARQDAGSDSVPPGLVRAEIERLNGNQ
jgi:hypothetical protein